MITGFFFITVGILGIVFVTYDMTKFFHGDKMYRRGYRQAMYDHEHCNGFDPIYRDKP